MSRAQLRASLTLWRRRLAFRQRRLKVSVRHHRTSSARKWRGLVDEAHRNVSRRELQLAAARPLRLKALDHARALIGVMEQGGNNAGPMVLKIIRANGGSGPEPWCGDFQAFCYRAAGSKAVTRAWASVRALGGLFGIRRVTSPLPGDLVRFTFDHVGMFEKDNGDGTITTIEGNTGSVGAVSDSSTGGDGVYRKRRAKNLVNDYLRVTR